ncbi:2-amino-4-hydroxy-6-hydroxymethyldihydropteridinepyrophosphokinase [hydrothermal vent metagenome]|uniref:2-amino-4-hydroxy-6-hydroxymethyldihydropteridine diphosphokinase n=1 Tax=hydrothermal vent metagenome TaxID=652676 RepID=A0A3B1BTM9_9ZZZZ
MSKVYIGLGSNKGDRIGFLHHAISELESDFGITILTLSSIYETKPYGVEDQPNYLNAVILIETDYTPIEVYHKVKTIEKIVGRTKSERWGEREIDLDIILYDSMIYKDDLIEIPHKEYYKRDFVLVPLHEIGNDLIDPITKQSISEIIENLDEKFILKKLESNLKEKVGGEIV